MKFNIKLTPYLDGYALLNISVYYFDCLFTSGCPGVAVVPFPWHSTVYKRPFMQIDTEPSDSKLKVLRENFRIHEQGGEQSRFCKRQRAPRLT